MWCAPLFQEWSISNVVRTLIPRMVDVQCGAHPYSKNGRYPMWCARLFQEWSMSNVVRTLIPRMVDVQCGAHAYSKNGYNPRLKSQLISRFVTHFLVSLFLSNHKRKRVLSKWTHLLLGFIIMLQGAT
jgi:hypothetical protein